jgi:hypothetical protein
MAHSTLVQANGDILYRYRERKVVLGRESAMRKGQGYAPAEEKREVAGR